MSSIDFAEILDYLNGLNFSGREGGNGSNSSEFYFFETMVCNSGISRNALLHSLAFFYVFIFVVGLAANSVVVWVNLRTQRSRYETHLYVLNLAMADLCVVATLPIWVASLVQNGHWPLGEAMCKLTHLVFSVNLFGSIFFLTCMSVDRYVSVVFLRDADSRRRKVTRRLVCLLVWLLALAASSPDLYFLTTAPGPSGETFCRPAYPQGTFREWMVGIQLSFVILGFAIPFPVIAIFYILLAGAITSSSDPERRLIRKVILTYIVVFLVCWLPYHAVLLTDVLAVLEVLPFSCELEDFLYVADHFTQCFSLLHCCVNPVIYNFINRNYRYDLMKAFIFKYSTRTGLARLMDASRGSETEYTAVEGGPPL
ncbi:atypical chemokine receptor 3-like [Polypterus senegalus]